MAAFLFSIYNSGYLFSILISKIFADKWGATRVIGYSTLVASILTLITPVAYYFGVFVLFSVRFLIGFLSVSIPNSYKKLVKEVNSYHC